jgi:hypothetical protein
MTDSTEKPTSGENEPKTSPSGHRHRRKRKGATERSTRTVRTRPASSLDEQGRERPAFLLDFPEDPELGRLVDAYDRGDYRLVRREAEPVAEAASNPAVRRAARELRRRIDPDPLARYLLFVAVGLLAFLVFWTYFLRG